MLPGLGEHLVELGPDRLLGRVTIQNQVVDGPRLLARSPTHDLELEAVALDVDPTCQEDRASRNRPGPVLLAASVEALPVGRVPLLLPGLPQHRVDEHLELRRVTQSLQELLDGVLPAEPTDRAVQRRQVVAAHVGVRVGVRGLPAAGGEHRCLLVLADENPALLARIADGITDQAIRESPSTVGVETSRILRRWKVAVRFTASSHGSPSPSASCG